MTNKQTRDARRLPGAVRWAVAEGLLSSVVTFITTLITARFVIPAEFGLATIAIAVQAVVQGTLIDGPAIAIIRMRSADTRRTDSILWGMLFLGIVGAAICFGLGILVSNFYSQPVLRDLVAIQGLVCILTSCVSVPTAIYIRKLRLRRLTLRMLWQKGVTLLVTAVLAIYGYGAWAVVSGSLGGALAAAIVIWSYQARLPRLTFSFSETWGTLRLGWMIGLETLLSMLAIRMSLILFGRFHGLHALGLVNFSLRLTDEVGSILNTVVARTAMSVFSDISRRGGDVARAYRAGAGSAALFSTPIFLGLATVFPTLIPLLFGQKWEAAVIPAQIIAVLWSIRATRVLAPALLRTYNVQGPLLANSVIAFTVSLIAVVATAQWDWRLALVTFVLPTLVNLPSGIYYVSRFAHVSPLQQFNAVAVQYLGGLAMAIFVASAVYFLPSLSQSAAGLAIQVAGGAVFYGLYAIVFQRPALRHAWSAVVSKT